MLCIWLRESAHIVAHTLTPTELVDLRKVERLPKPPQTANSVGVSHLRGRGAALPGYQTRFDIAPTYAVLPPVSPHRRPKNPDVQTVRALRGFISQGKARPGPSPQGVRYEASEQSTVMIGCARNPEVEAWGSLRQKSGGIDENRQDDTD